jgi:hypothetical protein
MSLLTSWKDPDLQTEARKVKKLSRALDTRI